MRHSLQGDCDIQFFYICCMINVSILALRNSVLASIADSRQIFVTVNEFLQQSGNPPLFNVKLVGVTGNVNLNDGLFSLHPEALIADVEQTDLVIIPSLAGDMISSAHNNRMYAAWIAQQYKNGAEIASLGVGTFLLAFSGLLNGKECTTHWMYANEFRHFYPSTKLTEDKIFTEQNGLYSSGGGSSYWNLLLYLVEKYTSRQIAIHTAKYFVIDLDRSRQSPFVVFRGLKDHDDEVIKKGQEYIEQHYREKLTVDQVAAKLNITRRTFERRFRKATFITVAEYIQRIKIEAAKKRLEIGRKSIHEIMLEIGYSDTQTFRDVFKKITDMTPVEYRNKYNKNK
jgi:transcriptional regulator GlxA family with amidase domain